MADVPEVNIGANNNQSRSNFITAYQILHHHSLLDACSHISIRNPSDPSKFYMSPAMAHALVSSFEQLDEYHVADASPVVVGGTASPGGNEERYLHSEILKRFPGVNCVVYSQNADVLPYTINGVPLRAADNMTGFLGPEVPTWDIATAYNYTRERYDLSVRNPHLGASFAAQFSKSKAVYVRLGESFASRLTGNAAEAPQDADFPVVLMRGQGFTTVARSIEQAVYQAIYTKKAAHTQTVALSLVTALVEGKISGKVEEGGNIKQGTLKPVAAPHYLSPQEITDVSSTSKSKIDKCWALWAWEVEASRLYVNNFNPAS